MRYSLVVKCRIHRDSTQKSLIQVTENHKIIIYQENAIHFINTGHK